MPAASTRPRTVLVTGASSGIGRATARRFAAEGFRVFGTSRQQRPDEHGVEMVPLDVCSDKSVQQCVGRVLARADQIDVLVHNAGVMHRGFTEETPPEQAHAVFETNFFGATRVIQAVLPSMRERRDGRIITVGSLSAQVGEPGEGFYAASKAALARYTEALRHEVAHCGVSVSLVEPGAFTTNVDQAAITSPATIADYDSAREQARRTLQHSLRHGGDPRRAAATIVGIARARSPLRWYGAGREARWIPLLTTLLPQQVVDGLLRRSFHLPKQQRPGQR